MLETWFRGIYMYLTDWSKHPHNWRGKQIHWELNTGGIAPLLGKSRSYQFAYERNSALCLVNTYIIRVGWHGCNYGKSWIVGEEGMKFCPRVSNSYFIMLCISYNKNDPLHAIRIKGRGLIRFETGNVTSKT